MGRPIKRGLDYFPLDTNYYDDEKISDLTLEFGYLAEVVYLRVLAIVYKNGYYLEMSVNTLAKLIRRSFLGRNKPPAVDVFERVIIGLSKHGLLDGKLMEEKVITSKGIQKQYLISTQRRKNVVLDEYCLLTDIEMLMVKKYHLNNDDVGVFNKTRINSRTTNKRGNKANLEGVYGGCKQHFLTRCLMNGNYIDIADIDVIKYNEFFVDTVDEFGFELVLSVTNYVIKYAKKNTISIDNKFEFFRSSCLKNCETIINRNERGDFKYDDFLEVLKELDIKT